MNILFLLLVASPVLSLKFSEIKHGVKGHVTIQNNKIHVTGFNYDGSAPDAFFLLGQDGTDPKTADKTTAKILAKNGNSFSYSDQEEKNKEVYILKKEVDADITLTIPEGTKVKWLAVYCRQYDVNFGHILLDVTIKDTLKTLSFSEIKHGVKGHVTIGNDKIHVTDFHYDGSAPDAFFLLGSASLNSLTGMNPKTADKTSSKILAKNGQSFSFSDQEEKNKKVYLLKKEEVGTNITLTIPEGTTPKWLAVYCRKFDVEFGHVCLDGTNDDEYGDNGCKGGVGFVKRSASLILLVASILYYVN